MPADKAGTADTDEEAEPGAADAAATDAVEAPGEGAAEALDEDAEAAEGAGSRPDRSDPGRRSWKAGLPG
jgi:hypothetical protein